MKTVPLPLRPENRGGDRVRDGVAAAHPAGTRRVHHRDAPVRRHDGGALPPLRRTA